jgi:uncharacterized membrane protein (GlpM family)
MVELVIRFLIGGLVVSAFAVLGDILGPKSFAGLFGAAPSVALATIPLTIAREGAGYAAIEARSMLVGAIAFVIYACAVSYAIQRFRLSASLVAPSFILLWAAVAFSLRALWLS